MRKQLFIFLFLVLLFSACTATAPQASGSEAPGQTIIITRDSLPTLSPADLEITDPSNAIEAAPGDHFTITLRTNPASGYHWELAEELDSSIVEYVWKDFVPAQPDQPNASGKDVWRFKAVAPGEARIVLGYYMGMTEDSAEMLTFTVVVE